MLLLVALYPAFFLSYRVAPEAVLRSSPPWRSLMGPFPAQDPVATLAARQLGPRLATIARHGLHGALWNPAIGGGRAGWLSSAREGGSPLALLAALVARPSWTWTALVALQIAVAFSICFAFLAIRGKGPWAAVTAGLAYAFSGPVASQWLTWPGAAMALGPLGLLPLLVPTTRWRLRTAAWALVLVLFLTSGPPALPFVAVALAAEAFLVRGQARSRFAGIALAAALAVGMHFPTAWLEHAAAEEGSSEATVDRTTPPVGLREFLSPGSAEARGSQLPKGGDTLVQSAFLGWPILLLAVIGVVGSKSREMAFWLGVFAVGVALSTIPVSWASRLGVTGRPLAVVALAGALLAGHGVSLLEGMRLRTLSRLVGPAVGVVLLFSLVVSALRGLPFGKPSEANLPSPLPATSFADGSRLVALLGAMPPDIPATLGAADVRAFDLSREPTYGALLGQLPGGELPLARALDPATARLGGRWVVEPLPSRVVSGKIFASIEVVDVRRFPDSPTYPLDLPKRACRLGLPATLPIVAARLAAGPVEQILREDNALADESDDWRWFAIPEGWASGKSRLVLLGEPELFPADLPIAWDSSALRLRHETRGVRVWEWGLAPPFAFLATSLVLPDGEFSDPTAVSVPPSRATVLLDAVSATPGDLQRFSLAPDRVELAVAAERPALMVVQVKYRPHLWRVRMDDQRVETQPVDGVWTGFVVPRGRSHVVMSATLPTAVVGTGLLAAAAILALAWCGRKR